MERMCVPVRGQVVCHSVCLNICCLFVIKKNVFDYGRDVGMAASDVSFHRVHKMDSRLDTVPP